MPIINGVYLSKEELLKKCGTISQVAGFKRYTFSEGRAKGVEAVDVNNGNGLKFTVLLDRTMDIAWCDYCGINLSYISKNQIVSPYFYDKDGIEWLRTFSGGLLATCGITYAGAACDDNGEKLGLHGRIGASPADNICCESYWDGEDYIIEIRGKAHESRLFGENLVLSREIKVKAGENKIHLHDKIENLGYESSPIMMIYHFNLGFPLVDAGSRILINSIKCTPIDEIARSMYDKRFTLTEPQHGISENVYFHEMENKNGKGTAALFNEKLGKTGVGIYLKFDLKELPYLNQWKMMGEGEYVVGLEPSNCMTLGRSKERERGALRFIEPGEIKDFEIEVGILEDINEFYKL